MEILYSSEQPQVYRRSSIDQFSNYLSTWAKGGWAPIVFDKLDSIGTCSGIKSHPIIISWDPVGYIFPEAHCTYVNDKFITVDKKGGEMALLPECQGPGGFYERFIDKRAFVNFDAVDGVDSSLGIHQTKTLRTGLDYVEALETLPVVD